MDALRILRDGELDVRGRLVVSSNAALFCHVELDGEVANAVYKPIRFERPLWDFPDGTLAGREAAAFVVSEATGWGIVPPTVMRDGPAGSGMVQLWLEADSSIEPWDLVRSADDRLRPMAVFDAIVNNTDRKGGHILPVRESDGAEAGRLHLFGVDHGVCFSIQPKLRTVLWAWSGTPLSSSEVNMLRQLRADLDGQLGMELRALITPAEVGATVRRVEALLADGCFPRPDPDWPAIPWPPF